MVELKHCCSTWPRCMMPWRQELQRENAVRTKALKGAPGRGGPNLRRILPVTAFDPARTSVLERGGAHGNDVSADQRLAFF